MNFKKYLTGFIATLLVLGVATLGTNVANAGPESCYVKNSTSMKCIKANLSLNDAVYIMSGSVDPSAGSGTVAPRGSLYLRTSDGTLWAKTSTPAIGWAVAANGVTNAAVLAKVLTGYVSGAGTVAATDTLLQAFNKLNGNVELKKDAADFASAVGLSITLDQGVGAVAFKAHKTNNIATLCNAAITTADGGDAALLAAAAQVPAAYRPLANVKFPVIVTDAGAKTFGSLLVGADGSLTIYSSLATDAFTDDAAAGMDATCVTYNVL